MKRELNTPDEMLKRLIYVIYVVCLFFSAAFGLMGLLGGRVDAAIAAAFFIPASVVLKYYGVRRFDFNRLAKSFPVGDPQDALSKEIRHRFEELVVAFHDSQSWANRQTVRLEIEKMVTNHPLLFPAFKADIAEVHPNLFHALKNTVD